MWSFFWVNFGVLFTVHVVHSGLSENISRHPEIRLFEDLFKNFSKGVRPVENKEDKVIVTFGLTYHHIVNLDEKNQVLVSNAWVRQKWFNPHLVWDPEKYEGISRINVDPDKVWLPDLVMYNNAATNTDGSLDKAYNKVKMLSTGEALWLTPYMFSSRCYIHVKFFPIDQQICPISFGSWTYDSSKLQIKSADDNGASLVQYSNSSEWELVEIPVNVSDSYFACCPQPFTTIAFYVTINRRPLYYIFNFIVPCYLILWLSLFTFFMPPESSERITLVVTALLSMVVSLVNINDNLPTTSDDTPILSELYSIAMFETAMSTVATCVVLRVYYHNPKLRFMPKWGRTLILLIGKLVRARIPTPLKQKYEAFKREEADNTPKHVFIEMNISALESQSVEEPGNVELLSYRKRSSGQFDDPFVITELDESRLPELVNNEGPSASCENSARTNLPGSTIECDEPIAIETVTNRTIEEEDLEMHRMEWLFAAIVIDKACYCVFVFTVIIATFIVILQAPRYSSGNL